MAQKINLHQAGFIETETFNFSGLSISAGSFINTGQSISPKYLSGWAIIAADSMPSAGLYSSYLSANGAIYINSTRSNNVTGLNCSVTYVYIKQ